MIYQFTNETSFHKSIYATPLVLVDFYADWCEPCKWLGKILSEMDPLLPNDVSILMVNTEEFPSLALERNVKSVPIICLFKNGQEVWRINGFLTLEELLEKIRSFL